MSELRELFHIARSQWLTVVTLLLLGAFIAAGVNLIIPVSYVASARLFIATPNWNDSTAIWDPYAAQRVTSYGDEFSQMRIATYQRLANTPGVTLPVIDKLHLGMTPSQLASQIECRPVPDTVMLDILVRDHSAPRSAAIANAVAQQLSEYIKQLEKPSYNAASPVQPVVVRPAAAPQTASSPRVLLNIVCGGCIGLLVGLTIAVFRGGTSRNRMPIGELNARPPLGVLSLDDAADQAAQVVDVDEEARFLRVQLQAVMADVAGGRLLITSPRASQSAWQTAVQLASALGEAGNSAVVVVADFSLRIRGGPSHGLGDVLQNRASLDSVIMRDSSGKLAMVMPGDAPGNTTAAFATSTMAEVVEKLGESFDYVLVVAPAVLESIDAVDLAAKLDASVMTCPLHTGAHETAESERLLSMVSTPYLGRIIVVGTATLSTAGQSPQAGQTRHKHRGLGAGREWI